MRTYGQKLIRSAADRATRKAQESRDAILWDIQPIDRVCRCKIQGSNEYVIARFPQNWNIIPSWCKPGQAVRLQHKGGVRGYIEIVGYGRAIPTPISGGSTPTVETPSNAILSGCQIKAIPQTAQMAVYVTVGTARFNGITSSVPPLLMNANSVVNTDMGLTLGIVAGVFIIPTVSSGKFRYDLFSLGTDLMVYRTAGTEFTSAEVKPVLPNGCLEIGYLLVSGGQTEITSADIAQIWTTPEPSILSATMTDNGITWDAVVGVLDQYGNAITTSIGWTITATIEGGDGSISPAKGNTGAGNTYTFTYTEGTAGEVITIAFSLSQGDYSAEGMAVIQL